MGYLSLDQQIQTDFKDGLTPDPAIETDSVGRASIVIFPMIKSMTISKNGYETHIIDGNEELPNIVVMSRSREKSK